MSTPLVTVAIPTLRQPAYLREALASVLSQSYRHLQVIVSNDAAADETTEAVRAFADSRILLLENPAGPGGIVANFNRALSAAAGDYFVLVCHDDRVGPDFVRAMVECFEERSDAVVGLCPQEVIDEHGQIVRRLLWPTEPYLPGPRFVLERYAGQHRYVTLISAFYRTASLRDIGGFPAFAGGEHSENGVVIRLAARGSVAFASGAMFQYRVHEASYGLKAYRAIARSSSELLDYIASPEVREAYGASHGTLVRLVIRATVNDYVGRMGGYFVKDHSIAETIRELIRHGLLRDRRLRAAYLAALPRTLVRVCAVKAGLWPRRRPVGPAV